MGRAEKVLTTIFTCLILEALCRVYIGIFTIMLFKYNVVYNCWVKSKVSESNSAKRIY